MVATPQELLSQLPPSDRDFAVFEEVVVARGTTREAAAKFGISQTRVCQILERVWEFSRQTLPGDEVELSSEELQRAAQLLAAERLDHLYSLAMQAFEASKANQVKHREGEWGSETTTTTSSCGDPRWLQAAMRISLAHGKAGIPSGIVTHARAKAATVADERELLVEGCDSPPTAAAQIVPAERRPSPVGDCSEIREFDAKSAASPAACHGANGRGDKTSKRLSREQRLARESFLAPVQKPASRDFSPAVAQLTLSPDQPGARLQLLG
jgi:hypothetical protein